MNYTNQLDPDALADHKLDCAIGALRKNPGVSEHNRLIVESFVRDCKLGKTHTGRSKKTVGPARLSNTVAILATFAEATRKQLDQLATSDIERFVEALMADDLRSRQVRWNGQTCSRSGKPYSASYKANIKITVRKFLTWQYGNGRDVPDIARWMDTTIPQKCIPALSELEVERLVDNCRSVFERSLVQTLFDGGMRIGECASIQLQHLSFRQIDPSDDRLHCYVVRIPKSKTMPRTIPLPMPATTKWLSLWLEEHPARPFLLPDGTFATNTPTMPLFPLPNHFRQQLARRGRRALGRRVWPHLLRHSSATYWANRLPYFQFCKRFGWTMTSDMPRRYIDREGVNEMAAAQIYAAQTLGSGEIRRYSPRVQGASRQPSSGSPHRSPYHPPSG